MAVDATVMASPAAVESTADPSSALPAESTGAGDALENPVAGDGLTSEPTPEGDPSAEAGSLEEDDDEPKPDETSEQRKSRSDRQFENRLKAIAADPEKARALLGPILDPLIQADRERTDSERKASEAQQQTAAQARQAALARQQKLQEFIGVPDAPGKPGTLSTLQAEYDTLNRQIRSELVTPTGTVDLDALTQQADQKAARIERTRENLAMTSEIEDYVWSQFGNEFASAAQFPELAADPAKQSAYLTAQGGVSGALRVLADTIRSAKDAEKTAALKERDDKHAAEVKALKSEVSNWRVRAGAEEVPDVGTGRPAAGGGRTVARLIREAGSVEAYIERASRGDYAGVDLSQ